MSYTKNPATIKQQIEILKKRGCIIEDTAYAEECLTRINYYRLAHYFAPFLEEKGRYKEGTRFENVMKVYDFDRFLRRLIMTYLEETEIFFRAVISNYHTMKYGAVGYLNASSFDKHHNHQMFLAKTERLAEANEKEDFVSHHKKKYGGVMPLWAMMELFSFGTLAYFFADMKITDKKDIADRYFDINFRCIEDRLLCLSDLRNACAHYTRLYCNSIGAPPKAAPDFPKTPDDSLVSYLIVARSLYPDKKKWDNEFVPAFFSLIDRFSMIDKMEGYGFAGPVYE